MSLTASSPPSHSCPISGTSSMRCIGCLPGMMQHVRHAILKLIFQKKMKVSSTAPASCDTKRVLLASSSSSSSRKSTGAGRETTSPHAPCPRRQVKQHSSNSTGPGREATSPHAPCPRRQVRQHSAAATARGQDVPAPDGRSGSTAATARGQDVRPPHPTHPAPDGRSGSTAATARGRTPRNYKRGTGKEHSQPLLPIFKVDAKGISSHPGVSTCPALRCKHLERNAQQPLRHMSRRQGALKAHPELAWRHAPPCSDQAKGRVERFGARHTAQTRTPGLHGTCTSEAPCPPSPEERGPTWLGS